MLLAGYSAKSSRHSGLPDGSNLGRTIWIWPAVVILFVALTLAGHTALNEQDWYNASIMIPVFDQALDWVAGYLPPGALEEIGAGLLEVELPGSSGSED